VAQLIVRDLSADLVMALKRRAAQRNRSAEQEHREILKAALQGTKRRPLAAVGGCTGGNSERGGGRRLSA
jgi:plasmid stability protein